jgi:hypothetical protein
MRSRLVASRVVTSVACALAAIALGSACADEEILLAKLPPSIDGGRPPDATRCVDETGCSATTFCSRRDCSDVAGTCEMRPVVCEEEASPVCGCDGITYWNDCLRRAAGITAMTVGVCEDNAVVCGRGPKSGPSGPGSEECPTDTFCARLLPSGGPPDCPSDVLGTCWARPAVCPDRAGPDRWVACGASRSPCATTCDAIRTGERYKRAKACPP